MLGDVGVFGPESAKICDLQISSRNYIFLGERATNLQNHLPMREKTMSIVLSKSRRFQPYPSTNKTRHNRCKQVLGNIRDSRE
jgi:hypothetical protein